MGVQLHKFPISLKKTFWASTWLVFLGFMIDTENQTVSIPEEKISKARALILSILESPSKKTTVRKMQQVCGFLNFIGRCIMPSCAFTRHLYLYTTRGNAKMFPHYHIRVSGEVKADLILWLRFIDNQAIYCRPFMDFSRFWWADEIDMYSDASKNLKLGFGPTARNSGVMDNGMRNLSKKWTQVLNILSYLHWL